jgi:formyltetrahydrofolate synthetase
MKNIKEIAAQLHIFEDDLILYGNYENILAFGIHPAVAINKFTTDTDIIRH